jgi:hypothetical protein
MATDLHHSGSLGYETQDVSPRGLAYFLLIIGLILVITSFALRGLFAYYVKTDRPTPVVQPVFSNVRLLPPPPRIQNRPGDDIQNYLDAQRRLLNTSGWIDQKSGIARIPIDRAMSLLLRQGLPVQNSNAPEPPPASQTSRSAPPGQR